MTLIQFYAILFSALILLKTFFDFRKNKISLPIFLGWFCIWSAVIVVAALPQVTLILETFFGAGRGLDATVYFSILLIFFILFKIIAKLERIDREITEIIRNLALRNPKQK